MEFIPITGGLLTVVNVTDNNSKLIFHPQDKQITIGRSEECVIHFESEKNISKVQVTIDYVVKCGCWFLKDGNEESASTNGTILYAINEYPNLLILYNISISFCYYIYRIGIIIFKL